MTTREHEASFCSCCCRCRWSSSCRRRRRHNLPRRGILGMAVSLLALLGLATSLAYARWFISALASGGAKGNDDHHRRHHPHHQYYPHAYGNERVSVAAEEEGAGGPSRLKHSLARSNKGGNHPSSYRPHGAPAPVTFAHAAAATAVVGFPLRAAEGKKGTPDDAGEQGHAPAYVLKQSTLNGDEGRAEEGDGGRRGNVRSPTKRHPETGVSGDSPGDEVLSAAEESRASAGNTQPIDGGWAAEGKPLVAVDEDRGGSGDVGNWPSRNINENVSPQGFHRKEEREGDRSEMEGVSPWGGDGKTVDGKSGVTRGGREEQQQHQGKSLSGGEKTPTETVGNPGNGAHESRSTRPTNVRPPNASPGHNYFSRSTADVRPTSSLGTFSSDTAGAGGDDGDGDDGGSGGDDDDDDDDGGRGHNDSAGRLVPSWVRPSRAELEKIVETQFSTWRTLPSIDALASKRPNALQTHHQGGTLRSTAGGSSVAHEPKAKRRGFFSFFRRSPPPPPPACRPMRQGMAPYSEADLRRCYDEIRKDFVFGEPLRQVDVVIKGSNKAIKASPRGVVTFMSTSREPDVRQLKEALTQVSKNFLDQHRYPIAIIHEDFSAALMATLAELVAVPIHFVCVSFKLPDWMEPLSWIYPLAVKHFTGHAKSVPLVGYHSEMRGLLPYVKRGGFGYFQMCRFFSGAGYLLPFFDDFDFYLRLDTDSMCKKALPDLFSKLQDDNADYAFSSTFLDYGDKTQGLWNFAEEYITKKNISTTFWDSSNSKGGDKRFKVVADAKRRSSYPHCEDQPSAKSSVVVVSVQGAQAQAQAQAQIHEVPCQERHFQAVPAFYTNFEVARIEMLRSSWYQEWFDAVDETGSLYYNRWGDAPIRFLGLAMHLPAEKILKVDGCRHK